MDKRKALQIVLNSVKRYNENLKDKNLLFVFYDKNNKTYDYMNTIFLDKHFAHLTGFVYDINKIKSSKIFYQRCLEQRLSLSDFELRKDGTSELKLSVLLNLMDLHRISKMIGNYDATGKIKLYSEKITGNIFCCMGFVKEPNKNIYVPNSTIREDIRTVTYKPQHQIVAILKKHKSDSYFNEICYLSDKFDKSKLQSNTELMALLVENLLLEPIN